MDDEDIVIRIGEFVVVIIIVVLILIFGG